MAMEMPHIEINNQSMPPTTPLCRDWLYEHWESGSVGNVCYHTVPCLSCRMNKEHRLEHKRWEPYICVECHNRMLRDGHFVIDVLHNFTQELCKKRYSEEEFFIRLDHILKTLKSKNIITHHTFHFDHYMRKHVNNTNFHIEIFHRGAEGHYPPHDAADRGVCLDHGSYYHQLRVGLPQDDKHTYISNPCTERHYRTCDFSIEDCCVAEDPPKVTKQEYLPKEHFKWEC